MSRSAIRHSLVLVTLVMTLVLPETPKIFPLIASQGTTKPARWKFAPANRNFPASLL